MQIADVHARLLGREQFIHALTDSFPPLCGIEIVLLHRTDDLVDNNLARFRAVLLKEQLGFQVVIGDDVHGSTLPI
jgi:hypothetical protein